MNKRLRQDADQLYIFLTVLFVAALVVCNLIANKFVVVDLGFKEVVLSAGVLPYPITFLITDFLSEVYGRKKTNRVVVMGFAATIFVLGILWLGAQFPAIDGSPVSNDTYETVFQNAWRVFGASMAAYLFAQLIDIRLFHFWKGLTKGKHLWLRNNASTILSQGVDTTLVVLVLFLGEKSGDTMMGYIIDGWMFKSLVALFDTPVIYLLTWRARSHFKLKKMGDELNY